MHNNIEKIILTKSEDLANFLLSVADILKKAASKTEYKATGNKLLIRDKQPHEVFDFSLDYQKVINRHLFDFARDPAQTETELTQKEANLLRTSVHAAHYLQKELDKQVDHFFEKYYTKYFKSK